MFIFEAKYLAPTETKGCRLKIRYYHHSITEGCDYAITSVEQFQVMADKLLETSGIKQAKTDYSITYIENHNGGFVVVVPLTSKE